MDLLRLTSLGGAGRGDEARVKPDAVGPVFHIDIIDPFRSPGRKSGARVFQNSLFVDAKRVNGLIRSSSYDYEAIGYADVLSQIAKKEPHATRRMMLYVLTEDANITSELINKFTDKLVLIATMHVMYDPEKCEIYLGTLTVHNPKIGNAGIDLPRAHMKLDWNLIKTFGSDPDTSSDK